MEDLIEIVLYCEHCPVSQPVKAGNLEHVRRAARSAGWRNLPDLIPGGRIYSATCPDCAGAEG